MAESTTTSPFNAAVLTALAKLQLSSSHTPSSAIPGEERSRRRGRSNELLDFRHYVAGDDPRDIDWNAVARHDELYTRVFAQEITQPLEVFIDTSPAMRWGKTAEKLECAMNLGLAMAQIGANSGTSTKIHLGPFTPIVHRRGRSIHESFQALNAKELGEDELAPLSETLMQRAKERDRALLVIISDGYDFEAMQPAIKLLHSRSNAIGLLQTLSRFELSPQMDADHTLYDGVDEVRVSSNEELLLKYQERLLEFTGMWRKAIKGVRGGYAMIPSDSTLLQMTTKELPNSGLVARR